MGCLVSWVFWGGNAPHSLNETLHTTVAFSISTVCSSIQATGMAQPLHLRLSTTSHLPTAWIPHIPAASTPHLPTAFTPHLPTALAPHLIPVVLCALVGTNGLFPFTVQVAIIKETL